MNIKPLAAFKTTKNSEWFAEDANAFWRTRVFGK